MSVPHNNLFIKYKSIQNPFFKLSLCAPWLYITRSDAALWLHLYVTLIYATAINAFWYVFTVRIQKNVAIFCVDFKWRWSENVSSKTHLVASGVGYLKQSIVVSPRRRIIHGHYYAKHLAFLRCMEWCIIKNTSPPCKVKSV